MMLIAVEAPNFFAGFEYDETIDRVTRCAPILYRHLMWKDRRAVQRICKRNGWRTLIIEESKQLSMFD
jgi:hypothetical protein